MLAQFTPSFDHYDSAWKNILDPTGSWGGGGDGEILNIMGNTKEGDKKDAEELAAKQKTIDEAAAAAAVDPLANRQDYTGDTTKSQTQKMYPTQGRISAEEQARKNLLKSKNSTQSSGYQSGKIT
ncbi:MAG: hypothetical protein ACPGWM_03935 [Flavobacteriales bacterium]